MALKTYLDLNKKVKKSLDTIQFNFRNAYNKAEETTKDNEGYINLDSLHNEGDRNKFTTTFNKSILNSAKRYFNIHHRKNFDVLKETQLMNGYIGFSGAEINQIMDSARENISYDGMAKTLEKNIESVMNKISVAPSTKLEESDANDVVFYTKSAGIVNPTKLQIPNMVELISEYEKNGIVTPRFINEKHYKL